MSTSVITRTGGKESVVVGPLQDINGNLLTGLTNIYIAIGRTSDKKLLDWSTMGFTTTPTTLLAVLVEWSSGGMPGVYYIDVDTSTFVSANTNDHYIAYFSQAGSPQNVSGLPDLGEIRMGEIVDKVEFNLDAQVSTRLPTSGYTAPLSGAATGVAVWDALLSGHTTAGTFGLLAANLANLDAQVSSRLPSAGFATATAAAVWGAATASYATATTFGALLGTTLDTNVGSRAASGAAMALTGGAVTAVQTGLATSTVLAAVQSATTAIMGAGFVGGTDDLHSAQTALAAVATSVSGLATSTALSSAEAAIIAEVDAKAAEMEGAGWSSSTDTLHAIRARGDAAWITAAGFTVPGSAMTLTTGERTTLQALILTDATPFSGAAITAMPTATATATWATTESGTAGTFGYGLWMLRMGLTNKMAITAPGTMVVYRDDNATPGLTWNGVRDGNGQPIVLPGGEPAQRLKAS